MRFYLTICIYTNSFSSLFINAEFLLLPFGRVFTIILDYKNLQVNVGFKSMYNDTLAEPMKLAKHFANLGKFYVVPTTVKAQD